ncbi:hypothetical protein KJ877_05535 [bacterium]|nr:hypothetical protein [bacterium]MBU1990494.1 hypothetical protein [bacterium]
MSVEEYLVNNINPALLKEMQEFKNSFEYKSIQKLASSAEYQLAKSEVLARDVKAHENMLLEIEKLQNMMFTPPAGSFEPFGTF